MKKILFSSAVILVCLFVFNACNKGDEPAPAKHGNPVPTGNYLAGLGTTPGYPAGRPFVLPPHISIVSSIRGGEMYKNTEIDKKKYTGPFPFDIIPKSWVSYGTGTFVNLYITFYNSLPQPTNIIIPGGLIFIDSLDFDSNSAAVYQKGFILQDVDIPIASMDTAFVILRAYCLNHTLAPSNYNAVYFIGPITSNPDLDSIVTIMGTKQYPFGEEYNIQQIIWNVTDYGLNLTSSEVQYLNSLP